MKRVGKKKGSWVGGGGQEGVKGGKYDEITLLTPENGTVKLVTIYNGHRSIQTKIKLSCHFFKGENSRRRERGRRKKGRKE